VARVRFASLALVLLVAALYASIPIYRFPAPASFSGSRFYNPYEHLTGTWQRANLHAHGRAWSGLTSGRHSNEEVVRRYRELGYAVAGVSNYHHIAAQDGVPTLPLYEHGYNIGKHHQLAIGAHRVEWLDLPLWQSRSHLQFLIDRVAATADLVAIVHPVSRNAYTAADLRALTGYQLIEIVNGKFPHDEAWDAALSAGHAVWALANDDNHDLSEADRLAVAWNMIDAPTTSTTDIVEALRAGRTYAILRTGDRSTNADVALASVAVTDGALVVTTSGDPSTIAFVGQNGEVRKTVAEATTAAYTFNPADTYIRTVVRTPQSTLYLNPVVRYDGVALPTPAATVDRFQTWLLRIAALGVLIAVLVISRRRRTTAAVSALVVAMAFTAAPARGQGGPSWTVYDAEELADLPIGDNAFAVIETMQPSLISDRFTSGGLYAGEPARVGGFLSSWTQTVYRVGDVDVTDPTGRGAALIVPDVMSWTYVSARTAMLTSDVNAPGVAISFGPQMPSAKWSGIAQGAVSHFRSPTASGPVAIADLRGWDRAAVSLSGPLIVDRLGVATGGSWTRGSQIDRGDGRASVRSIGSGFAHLVLTPGEGDVIRAFGVLQRASRPFVYRVPFGQPDASTSETAGHLQLTWNRRRNWWVYGGYTTRRTKHDYDPSAGAVFERLWDGLVSELAWIAPENVRRWSLGARFGPSTTGLLGPRHVPRAGLEAGGARASAVGFPAGIVREQVDGRPARLWSFVSPAAESTRTLRTFAIDADDRVNAAPRLTVDAGLRLDMVTGSAEGASGDVRWTTWLPRGTLRWTLMERSQTAVFAGYRRSAYRLPLDFLAVGDPAAPVADIYRWTGVSPSATSLVAPVMRVGPGTGGVAAFSRIDPELARPVADEIAVGIEVQPRIGVRFGWTGIARRERNLIGLMNVGAPASAYSATTIADPGADVLNPEDDRLVRVYDRRPDSFGMDRYLLTNPAASEATFKGFEITARYTAKRFILFGGATAGIAEGLAASRGFGPLENDQSRLGELYVNPNAATFARGRLFNDRAYTVKLATVYRFRDDLRLGMIARYQDGQPFSRVLVVPNLNQGVEAVRAFPNGDSRFTYTATLDARLQKAFRIGDRRLAAMVDAYNLGNLANEVEEVTTSAPGVRIASAIQPPVSVHIGLRVTF
jgi:hypothetical protein